MKKGDSVHRRHAVLILAPVLVLLVSTPTSAGKAPSHPEPSSAPTTSPSASPSPRPSPSPSPIPSRGWKPRLRLKLVHRIPLDRNPKAAEPDEDSDIGRAPADVVAAGVIPPIVATPQAVVFLAPDGRELRRIALNDDPNFVKTAEISPRRATVVIGKSWSAKFLTPEEYDKAEGGEFPEMFTVYNASANAMYTATGTDGDVPRISDGGVIVLDEVATGSLKFFDPSTGAPRKEFQFLGSYGSGPEVFALNSAGTLIMVGASRMTVNGDADPQHIYSMGNALLTTAVEEAWAGMYSTSGQELWKTKLPDTTCVNNLGLSDDGQLSVVSTTRFASGPLEHRKDLGLQTFVLDGMGRVLSSKKGRDAAGGGIEWSPELGVFILGGRHLDLLETLGPDGSVTDAPGYLKSVHTRGPFRLVDRTVGRGLVGVLGLLRSHLTVLILTVSGELLLCQPIPDPTRLSGEPMEPESPSSKGVESDKHHVRAMRDLHVSIAISREGSHLAITFPTEIRVYSIARDN